MSQNLQNIVKFQKFQLENLVDFQKCCKTHIFLQKSEPTQPKTSNVLPKFCQPTLSDVSASAEGPAPRAEAADARGEVAEFRSGRGRRRRPSAAAESANFGRRGIGRRGRENANCGDPPGTLRGPRTFRRGDFWKIPAKLLPHKITSKYWQKKKKIRQILVKI